MTLLSLNVARSRALSGLFALLVLISSACAPRSVPAPEPVFYKGTQADLFAAAVQAISTSPGIDNSSGWVITQSDSSGGFISAQTSVRRCGFLGLGCRNDTESVSVVISGEEGRAQVIIQRSGGAAELARRIRQQLDSKFNRA